LEKSINFYIYGLFSIFCGNPDLVVKGGIKTGGSFVVSVIRVTEEEFLERRRISSKFDLGGSISEGLG
jgi:hypothetical protein